MLYVPFPSDRDFSPSLPVADLVRSVLPLVHFLLTLFYLPVDIEGFVTASPTKPRFSLSPSLQDRSSPRTFELAPSSVSPL